METLKETYATDLLMKVLKIEGIQLCVDDHGLTKPYSMHYTADEILARVTYLNDEYEITIKPKRRV